MVQHEGNKNKERITDWSLCLSKERAQPSTIIISTTADERKKGRERERNRERKEKRKEKDDERQVAKGKWPVTFSTHPTLYLRDQVQQLRQQMAASARI